MIFNNPSWDEENIIYNYKITAKVLAQCGIKLATVNEIKVDSPYGTSDLINNIYEPKKRNDPDSIYRLRKFIPELDKPALFHINTLSNGSVGSAKPSTYYPKKTVNGMTIYEKKEQPYYQGKVADSAFISAHYSTYGKGRDATTAHELIHLFLSLIHI